ncbi:MAG: Lrp/AsnC family transcriptional regulator [Halieaceae bacterium]
MEKATNHTIDRIDRKLMRALQRDNAEAISDLAERCGLSRSACSRRISRLEKLGFIKKHVALLDQEKLGLGLTVFVMIKTNQHNAGWSQQFQNVLDELTGVIEAHRMGGEVDYLLKAVVADMAGYDLLYQQLIKADLFDVSASFVMETMKNTTELPLS